MKLNLQTYKGLLWYFIPQVIFWVSSGWLLFIYGSKNCFLLLNGIHSTILDHPVLWLTEISGGYILISLFVITYARKRPVDALVAAVLVFVAWYCCIMIKYNFFPAWKSPSVLLKGQNIHVLGSQLQPELNFPSGHAVIVTALFTFTAWLFRYSKVRLLLISVIAVALTYTRIYSGWGYFSDILSGSLLGTLIALICIPYLENKIGRWYDRRSDYWKDMVIATLRADAICILFVNLKNFIL